MKSVNNIKAVKVKKETFRFSCHITFDIAKINQYTKQKLAQQTQLATMLPESRRISKKKALHKLLRNVPSKVLTKARDQLNKVQNQIFTQYPNCTKIDLEMDHAKQLQDLSNDDELDIRILSQQIKSSDLEKLLKQQDWLREQIQRRQQKGATIEPWFKRHSAILTWKQSIAKDDQ